MLMLKRWNRTATKQDRNQCVGIAIRAQFFETGY